MLLLRSASLLRSAALAGLSLVAVAAPPATQAQIISYSDRTSFSAATTSLTTFTFDGYAPSNGQANYPTGLTVQGVAFTANTRVFVLDPGAGFGDPFSGHQLLAVDSGQTLTVALPTGTTAFGADFSNEDTPVGSFITAIVNGTAFTFQEPGDTSSAFAGFISAAPITSLSFSGGFRGPALDNVSFGKADPAAVPEASSAAGFAAGLLSLSVLGVCARRKKIQE